MSLNYQIALTNVPFDKDYKNVIRFGTREEQEEYFQVSSLFSKAENCNLNAGNLFETTLFYKYTQADNLTELLNANYCIVKDLNVGATIKYLYFFVEDIVQDSGSQLKLRVKIDIFQTYYIDTEFSQCHISKAHLNRWVDNGGNTVSFDGTLTSKLFEREDLTQISKRLVSREKISLNNVISIKDGATFRTDNQINEWLDENVAFWVYGFVDPQHTYTFKGSNTSVLFADGGTRIFQQGSEASQNFAAAVDTQVAVVCCPIYKSNKRLHIKALNSTGIVKLDMYGMREFQRLNNDASYFLSIKASKMPPFSPDYSYADGNGGSNYGIFGDSGSAVNYTLDSDGNIILEDLHQLGGTYYSDLLNGRAYSCDNNDFGIFLVRYQFPTIISKEINIENLDIKLRNFTKSNIVGSNKSIKFNPKLYNQDYFELKIGNQTSDGFVYDLQKLNKTAFQIEYTEPLIADFNTSYSRIKIDDDNGIYISECSKNFTGFCSKEETSFTLYTTQWKSALAQQKNFAAQNILLGSAQSMFSQGSNMVGMDMSGKTELMQPAGIALARGIFDTGMNMLKTSFAIDNMLNAPASIKNSSSSPMIQLMTTELGVYVDIYSIISNEKNIVNDFMDMYGFTVNLIGNIKDYDNIRKYHNYIRANVEQTNGIPISEKVHEEFVRIFARGVRFWNIVEGVDLFKYDLENYEIALEE